MQQNVMAITPDGFAVIVLRNGARIETTRLHEGQYVRIDDSGPGRNAQYPQLCLGAARMGQTLYYHSPEQLARDCSAVLLPSMAALEDMARLGVDHRNDTDLA